MKWTKAAASLGNSNCVEVAVAGGEIWVRDSKDPDGPRLGATVGSWWSFIAAIRSGQLATYHGLLSFTSATGPWLMFREDDPAVTLTFTDGEAAAFIDGVHKGEFDPDRLAAVTA